MPTDTWCINTGMKQFTSWNPDWRYTKFNIDCLKEIQQEFLNVRKLIWHKHSDQNLEDPDPSWWDFSMMPRQELEPLVPTLANWFKSKGILDKWSSTAFAVVNKSSNPMDIHVDSTVIDVRRYSLNMPFINCDNTWTVWYDAEVDQTRLPTDIPPEVLHSRFKYDPTLRFGLWYQEQTATEIDRAEMDSPVIINITVPHRPVSGHEDTRILLCHRFTPELTTEEVLTICNQ